LDPHLARNDAQRRRKGQAPVKLTAHPDLRARDVRVDFEPCEVPLHYGEALLEVNAIASDPRVIGALQRFDQPALGLAPMSERVLRESDLGGGSRGRVLCVGALEATESLCVATLLAKVDAHSNEVFVGRLLRRGVRQLGPCAARGHQ
jgi:hypothetical protein